jgi:predicted PolB exonuclease-like 3'-5' exonuclease
VEKLPQKYEPKRKCKRNYEQKSIENLFNLIEQNETKMGWTREFFMRTIEIASKIYELGNEEEKKTSF